MVIRTRRDTASLHHPQQRTIIMRHYPSDSPQATARLVVLALLALVAAGMPVTAVIASAGDFNENQRSAAFESNHFDCHTGNILLLGPVGH